MVNIEHRLLSKVALDGLLSEIVLREGTNYGTVEISFEEKKQMLLDQLEKGRAHIVCDPEAGWCEIVRIEDSEKNSATQ